ncbi:MAG TPA: C25 family cysteine peptidase [Chitinophagaceae bacterium]|nr:C25 family cysteine peptidase [Chitinophagaceae bacterium]
MKRIFTLLLLCMPVALLAQQYNNEWINFSQTYYKFKVGADGVYRIPQSVLSSAGLGAVPSQNFQLWRNGEQVPLYITVSTGVLGASDYIEFWGKANDGKADKPLYRHPAYQHSEKLSLQTDTATYFLTSSPLGGPRYTNVANNVSGNSLPAEQWFWHTTGTYFNTKVNFGYATVVGEYVYSSSYDKGEFYSTRDIAPASPLTDNKANLYVYASGPDASFKYGAFGNSLYNRSVRISVNGTQITDTTVDFFNEVQATVNLPLSVISSGNASTLFVNTSPTSVDRFVISHYEIKYPRQFNFGAAKSFYFELAAKPTGHYLEIANFNYGAAIPVLYDLATHERFLGETDVANLVKFALPASTVDRKLVLVNEEASHVRTVTALTPKTFTDYNNAANQGNYIIISNPLLYNGPNGNAVQNYANYRQSANGGNFSPLIVDINELVDQFAFGIKKHPLSIKNFLKYARATFSNQPQFVLLIGRGMTYNEYRRFEANPDADRLNLVPTFGHPASDNNLAADDAMPGIPVIPIGRLSVVNGKEIEDYLEKMQEYETMQRTAPYTIAGRDWMKNVMHVTGASDPYLGTVLCNYMNSYKQLLEDTLAGAKVITFCKTSANPVEQVSNERISQLFEEGLSIVSYFGHSSSTTLEFNIDNPQNYNNTGKYPVFFVSGCNAGNFFVFDPLRFTYNETLSEKFTLAKQKGGIAFVASTHFGIVNYLNIYINSLYRMIGQEQYGKSLGAINKEALYRMMTLTGFDDYYSRLHAEEITIHGDPALKLNFPMEPDYVIEEPQIKISPAFISIADSSFNLKVKLTNIGRAVSDSITVVVRRQYPDGSGQDIYRERITGIRYSDSLNLNVPIVATRDKGANRITVTIDADNNVAEKVETNNTASKDVFIYEDEARPIYPYDFSIMNNPSQKLYASTANPFSNVKTYAMEIDTTEFFNSPIKHTKQISSIGGVLEFDPGIAFTDSTVYYWRTSLVPTAGGDYRWHTSSFMYKAGTEVGFNQSHFYQQRKSFAERLTIDSASRSWEFGSRINNVFVRNGVFPTAANQAYDVSVSINGNTDVYNVCGVSNIIFNVFDPVTMRPWINGLFGDVPKYGSDPICGDNRKYNFQFNILDTNKRRKIVEFMNLIPDGHFVIVHNTSGTNPLSNTYASTWLGDTSFMGPNNSMYHRLLQQGFTNIDSFNAPRSWIFAYKKNSQAEFQPRSVFSIGTGDRITMVFDAITPDTLGYVSSPKFGPAKTWKELQWQGSSTETVPTDIVDLEVIGIDNNRNETKLFNINQSTSTYDLSGIDAAQYPFLRLRMTTMDTLNLTPYQLKYWRLLYDPVPEGALAPNVYFTTKDTLEIGEKLTFAIAFKNISLASFDSLLVRAYVLDRSNVPHNLDLPRTKPLISGDTVILKYEIDTEQYPEMNTLFVDVNPNYDQPEQHHFNNFLFRNFYVKPDRKNPLLDVTFDGAHILNRDIVSPKPHIQIKLKDDAKFLLLNDTALTSVQVRYPDAANTLKTYNFNTDTLRFTPAAAGSDNTATLDFFPDFTQQISQDGDEDEYELIVKGKDRSGNKAGNVEYRVTFRVINKPMISNLLNYPNPFTTSTAFVFTITGSEIPQNIKIQILTVTGKIVREITKDELGPLRIGRNITEFKWDGTDQYGQRLANGVYLYRVVTTLNGKRMDKYTAEDDNTDKFFTRGYGKMYLMR